jgi:hypothetical protein
MAAGLNLCVAVWSSPDTWQSCDGGFPQTLTDHASIANLSVALQSSQAIASVYLAAGASLQVCSGCTLTIQNCLTVAGSVTCRVPARSSPLTRWQIAHLLRRPCKAFGVRHYRAFPADDFAGVRLDAELSGATHKCRLAMPLSVCAADDVAPVTLVGSSVTLGEPNVWAVSSQCELHVVNASVAFGAVMDLSSVQLTVVGTATSTVDVGVSEDSRVIVRGAPTMHLQLSSPGIASLRLTLDTDLPVGVTVVGYAVSQTALIVDSPRSSCRYSQLTIELDSPAESFASVATNVTFSGPNCSSDWIYAVPVYIQISTSANSSLWLSGAPSQTYVQFDSGSQ